MHTLILGLDGLDYNLLKATLPTMPFFKELTETAAWGMMVPDIALSPQSWATIFTGLEETKHHVTNFHAPITRAKCANMWRILNSYNLTCGVFNVTMTFPLEPVKGYMVSGYPTKIPDTFPPNILSGDPPPTAKGQENSWDRHHWAFREGARLTVKYDPFCSIIGSTLPDEFGHGFENAWRKGRKFILEEIYPVLDREVAALVEVLQPTVLAIFSDHGWNSEEYSDTLYTPWHKGVTNKDTFRPVAREDWAYHTKEGVGFFKGPHVQHDGELEAFPNRCFLPTMLDIWNLFPSLEFDGWPVTKFEYTEDEKRQIKENLRALGYE